MTYYFAYGSNLSEEQMNQRCPDSKLVGKAVLKGYKLDFDIYSPKWVGGCADIVKSSSDEVWGLVYDLSDEDIKKLDVCEGHPIHYRRIMVKVSLEGKEVEAIAYEVVSKSPKCLKPTDKYLGIIIAAAKKFGFPEKYRAMLGRFR